VFVISRKGGTDKNEFTVDITDRTAVKNAIDKIKPEIIFHLAASLNRERNFDRFDNTNDVNLNGTLNLLLALKDVKYDNFIFTSTSEIYGENKAPFTEGQIPYPVSPYSLTKVFSENLISTFSKTYNKNYTIFRLFNFFGRDMSPNFFIPQMINTLRNNETFKMTKGEQKRDFLHVNDVINALILGAKNKAKNDIYNVCSAKAVSLKQLVLEVKVKLNSLSDIEFGALPYRDNEVWTMVGDNSKLKSTYGFEQKYNLEKGIEDLIS
jgi:UDP-glucose 4-epimerase